MLHQLFQMIYNIQECNRKFTKETTEIITTYFLNFMDRLKALNILVHKHIADNLTIGKDIDNSAEEDKDDFEDANEIEESCFQVLKEISSKMLKTLSEKYNLSFGKGWVLSDEIRWLISFLRKQLVIEVFRRRVGREDEENLEMNENEKKYYEQADDISKVLLKFVFDPIIKDIQKLKFKKEFAKIIGSDRCDALKEEANYNSYVTTFWKFIQSWMLRDPSMING